MIFPLVIKMSPDRPLSVLELFDLPSLWRVQDPQAGWVASMLQREEKAVNFPPTFL